MKERPTDLDEEYLTHQLFKWALKGLRCEMQAWVDREGFDQAKAQRWVDRRRAIYKRAPGDFGACGCMGPRDGQPACPCEMEDTLIVNGRHIRVQDCVADIRVIDLGPVV